MTPKTPEAQSQAPAEARTAAVAVFKETVSMSAPNFAARASTSALGDHVKCGATQRPNGLNGGTSYVNDDGLSISTHGTEQGHPQERGS